MIFHMHASLLFSILNCTWIYEHFRIRCGKMVAVFYKCYFIPPLSAIRKKMSYSIKVKGFSILYSPLLSPKHNSWKETTSPQTPQLLQSSWLYSLSPFNSIFCFFYFSHQIVFKRYLVFFFFFSQLHYTKGKKR